MDRLLVAWSAWVRPYARWTQVELAQRLRQRNRAAQIAERRFQQLIEAAPSAMLLLCAQRHITLLNRRAEELFGYTRAELLGEPVEKLLPERYQHTPSIHISNFLEDSRPRTFGVEQQLYARRKDGTEVPIEASLNPIEASEGNSVLVSIIDIGERKRAEEELRRSHAELEQFAFVASHDLQEPLRMVANYTELLAERYRGQLDDKADKYLHYASDGARRMQRLVTDLLSYSRIGSQGKALVRVETNAVFRRVLDSFASVIQETGATVEQPPLPAVLADEMQLAQLFQNLVANAIKFRGTAAPKIAVRVRAAANRWHFSVSDNGIGFDMQYAERIFQMFQRLHVVGQYDGSGIGLAIAKRIVERHGGRIWVESQPAVGSTFHFTLRAAGEGDA